MTLRFAFAGLLAGLAITTSAVGGGTYRINSSRPAVIGQQTHVRGEAMVETSFSPVLRGRTQRSQTTSSIATLDALAEVLAVDADGRPVHMAYHVTTCTLRADGRDVVIAPAGSRLMARRTGDRVDFAIEGHPVPSRAAEALRMIVGLGSDGASAADLAEPDQRRAIGDAWTVDLHRLVLALEAETGQAVSQSDLSGQTRLVEMTERDGYPCLKLFTQVAARNAAPGLRRIPDGFELGDSRMTTTAHRICPLDPSMPVASNLRSTQVEAVLEGTVDSQQPFEAMHYTMMRVVKLDETPIDVSESIRTWTVNVPTDSE